jgi:hypothetical protein
VGNVSNWTKVSNSNVEYNVESSTIEDGQVLFTIFIEPNGSQVRDLGRDDTVTIEPGEVVAIRGKINFPGRMSAGVTFIEEY